METMKYWWCAAGGELNSLAARTRLVASGVTESTLTSHPDGVSTVDIGSVVPMGAGWARSEPGGGPFRAKTASNLPDVRARIRHDVARAFSQIPSQRAKCQPLAASAVTRTWLFHTNEPLHFVGQAIPTGRLRLCRCPSR